MKKDPFRRGMEDKVLIHIFPHRDVRLRCVRGTWMIERGRRRNRVFTVKISWNPGDRWGVGIAGDVVSKGDMV